MTAQQTSALPTNKLLTGAGLATVVQGAWSEIMANVAPTLAGDNTAMLAGFIVAMIVGYFVPDRVNVPA